MIDDGAWCSTCKTFHPTLRWHEKYGEELSQQGYKARLKKDAEKRPKLFGFAGKSKEEQEIILDEMVRINLESRDIAEADEGECAICGYPTIIISKKTGRHVCSDECLYKENGWKETATGETLVFE